MEPNEITTQNAPASSEPGAQQTAGEQFAGWRPEEIENWKSFQAQRTGQAPEPSESVTPEPDAIEEHDEPGSPTEPYDLEMPADVPPSRIAEWEPVLAGFGQVAAAAGLPRTVAENLMQSYVDADAAIGGYGAAGLDNSDPYSPDDAERVLRSYWRQGYDAQMKKVWKATSESPALREWLEDSGLGNDPRTCIALSHMSDLRFTKAEAQAELTKLMDPKSDYWSKDDWRRKPAVARVQLLTRIASAEARSTVTEPRARANNAEATRAEEAKTNIRAELAALAGKKTMTVTDRKRWIDLVARLD